MDKVIAGISKFLEQDLSKKNEDVGEFVADRLRNETRRGKSLSTETKLPVLRESTKAIREYRSRVGVENGGFVPSPFFKKKKSNLTQTGQLLGSIKYEVKNGKIEVGPTGSRDRSLDAYNEFSTNEELASDLQKRGFKFLGLDKRGRQRIRQMLIREIRRLRIKAGF